MTTLYLIRHASADERGPKYPDDTQRPLIKKGFKQAKMLAEFFTKLEIAFDHIFSSPYTRAMQTARPLEACLKTGQIQYLDSLTTSGYTDLLKDIRNYSKKAQTIAAVGHEPYLSEFSAYLLGDQASINFKKAAFISLSGKLEAAKMTLENFVPYSVYKHFK